MYLTADLKLLEESARRYESDGKYAQAAALFARAAASLEGDDPARAADLWRRAGVCAHQVYDHEHAAAYFRRAIGLFPAGHPARAATLARLCANLCYQLYADCQLQGAYTAGQEALRHAEASGDPRLCAAAALNLGLTARYLDNPVEALRYFDDARRWYLAAAAAADGADARKLASRAADALHNMGWVSLDLGQHQAAERALLTAQSEKQSLGEATGRIRVELARLRLLRGHTTNALDEVTRVLDSGEAQMDPETHLQSLTVAAEAAGAGDPTVGLRYAQAAVELALTLGRPPLLFDVLATMKRLHAAAGESPTPREAALLSELLARKEHQYTLLEEGCTDEDLEASAGGCDWPWAALSLNGESGARECWPAGGGASLEPGQSGFARRDEVGSQGGDRQGARSARGQRARRPVGRGRAIDAAPTGEALRKLRRALGLTQDGLAELAGCEPTTVWRAERGKAPERTVRALIAVLQELPQTRSREAVVFRRLGRAYAAVGDRAQAREAFIRAAEASHEAADRRGEALAEAHLAQLDLDERRPGGVVHRLTRCREILVSMGEEGAVWFVDVLLARAQTAIRLPQEAVRRLTQLLYANGSPPDRVGALEALAEAYEALGDSANAERARLEAARTVIERPNGEAVVRGAADRAVALMRAGNVDAAASVASIADSYGLAHRIAQLTRSA